MKEASVEPYLIITSDAHAGLPTEAYRPYLEKKYHAAFDQFLSERGIQLEEMTNLGVRNSAFADSWYAEHGEALNAGWDALKRDQQLDAEGICGEVIFPDADAVESRTCAPFGTGLGLSIVRHVATNHHGRVEVDSREGEGSTFTLVLPRPPEYSA